MRKSPAYFAVVSAIIGVLLVGVLTFVPSLAFGSFWHMAAILVAADLTIYVAMKLGWLTMRGGTQ